MACARSQRIGTVFPGQRDFARKRPSGGVQGRVGGHTPWAHVCDLRESAAQGGSAKSRFGRACRPTRGHAEIQPRRYLSVAVIRLDFNRRA